jgi:hypothetical protein
MAKLVRIKIKADGKCRKGSRTRSGRKGCWGYRGASMGAKKKRKY